MNNEEQDRFGELLDAYLEAVRSGKASSPEAFAAANPDLEDELRAVLPLLVDMEHVAQAGGDQPLASVRLTGAIPKARIFDAMRAINASALTAPVAIGDVVIHDLLGLGCDVIATRNVSKA